MNLVFKNTDEMRACCCIFFRSRDARALSNIRFTCIQSMTFARACARSAACASCRQNGCFDMSISVGPENSRDSIPPIFLESHSPCCSTLSIYPAMFDLSEIAFGRRVLFVSSKPRRMESGPRCGGGGDVIPAYVHAVPSRDRRLLSQTQSLYSTSSCIVHTMTRVVDVLPILFDV